MNLIGPKVRFVTNNRIVENIDEKFNPISGQGRGDKFPDKFLV